MFNIHKKTIDWGGRPLTLETGKIARQADGAVLATYGETSVLCTVVGAKTAAEGIDFFPLTIQYLERSYAAGRIPGGFFKRETKPSEKEVLTSRLIDRPVRPLFPKGFHNEVQVICKVISHDLENNGDIPAMVGASAALAISGLPFLGPIGGARVAYINDEFVLNPTLDQMPETKLDLVVAGTRDGVLMVESEAHELSEDTMLDAVNFGHEHFQPVIQMIEELAQDAGKERWSLEKVAEAELQEEKLAELVRSSLETGLREAYAEPLKQLRMQKVSAVKEAFFAANPELPYSDSLVKSKIKALESDLVRTTTLETERRIDGRDLTTVRPIECEVGFVPRAHGSALFTRGETQAMVITTLGTGQDEQFIDGLEGEYRERFLLHYNFPPYSVGETGRLGAPGRREIGHGRLAWRAINPLLPSKDEFPYTVRVVSEITESNGSSSMATVCGTSLSMMDAGLPLSKPIAGIAMGLILEGDKYAILSDILGDEDHLGDMDFKVAGSKDGVTALQMDIKVTGITSDIMHKALYQARDGRLHILGEMAKALEGARDEVKENAPRIVSMTIPKDRIGEVIGPGGKVIRDICETTGAKLDIDDDGKVNISGLTAESIDQAVQRVKNIVCDPEVGEIYAGKVAKTLEFGAFVDFMGSRSGLVHISALAQERVNKTEDIVKEGDTVFVKVVGFDNRGKIRLSMKDVDQQTGQSL